MYNFVILTSAGREIAHVIARNDYDEKITTIHTCKSYYDVIGTERESNQQQIQKNKTRRRILVVDDEYDVIPTNINPLTHVPEKVLEYI